MFFDLRHGDRDLGRVEMQLYSGVAPKTAENFRALCTGEKGVGKSGKPLHFKGCTFHRIISGFMMQGGDFTNGNGTGGESIYGDKFADEAFVAKHTRPGLLSMANSGPNTNGSQFFVTYADTPHLDDKHVVFGRVTKGFEHCRAVENCEVNKQSKPQEDVVIVDCGELHGPLSAADTEDPSPALPAASDDGGGDDDGHHDDHDNHDDHDDHHVTDSHGSHGHSHGDEPCHGHGHGH